MINEEPLTRPSVALNGLLCLPGCPGVCGTHDLASVKTLSGCHRSPRAFTAAELSTISHTAGSGLNSAVLDLAPNSFKILFETRGHPLTFSGYLFYSPLRSPRIEKFRPSSITSYPSRPGLSVAVYKPSEIILLIWVFRSKLLPVVHYTYPVLCIDLIFTNPSALKQSRGVDVSTRSTLTLTGTLDGTEAEAPDVCAADCNFKKTRASAQRHKFVIDTSHSPSSSSSSIRRASSAHRTRASMRRTVLSRRGGRSGWCISMGSLDGEVKERNEYKRIKRGNEKEITHPTPFPTTAQVERKLHATKREMPDRRRYTRTARITLRRSKPVERRRRQVPNVAVVRDFSVKPHRQPHTPATGNAIDEVEVADTATAPATIPFPHLRLHPRRSPSCCSWRRWRRQARPRSNASSSSEVVGAQTTGVQRASAKATCQRADEEEVKLREEGVDDGGGDNASRDAQRTDPAASHDTLPPFPFVSTTIVAVVWDHVDDHHPPRPPLTPELARNRYSTRLEFLLLVLTITIFFFTTTAAIFPLSTATSFLSNHDHRRPPSYHYHHLLLLTIMSTTGADLTSAISECESLVNRAYSVFYALFALVGAVVVALCVGRPPRTTSIKRLRHWIRTSSSFFFTTTTTWLFLLTATTMNPSRILVAISECTPLVNPLQLVLCTVALAVGAVVVTIRFGRPPRTTSLKRLRRWIRICELRIIARRTYNRLPPTLAEIRALRPLFRVATIAEFPDSYANDGYGTTYFNADVADETLGAYYEGLITAAEFLAEVRVKVGETVNLPNRQQGYNGCNFRQTHFWLCCFYPKKRKAAEKMSHSLFLDDAPRARLPCSCQPGKVHAEYWWLRDLGSFSEVGGRIRDVLALLGQPDLVRHDLRDAWLMSLVASDKRIVWD
ncbi:hypothetical protein C8F04DRAFT_1267342 [Mycena alexandri]|uniref:Uncharacterized protein n=1 Tax=Mycena alexandri TaxID=1745969 RepID=A0AAD6SFW9_9AGAR|nr:hypothetical protein C8F04DRAFT_1267342 [Mycena alexandri]